MKTSYKYIAVAFAALLCSCNKEIATEVIESQVQISADITPSILTRVTDDGTSFTNGDAIKVRNTNRENKNLATYTYSESTGKWSTSDELYWEGTSANIFHAWYPATVEYGSFTIPSDQTSGIAEADWMTATASAKKADGTVNLSFNHNLAKVTVTIDSWSNEYSASEKVANALELNSLSSIMSNDGTVSGDEAAKWVKAYVAQENTSFVAIIAPGTYASGDDIMQVYVNGSSTPLAVKTSSTLTLESGKAYRFKLSVGKNLAEITSSVTVGDWDDETLDGQQVTVDLINPALIVNLSSEGTANSYIVSQKGGYKFSTVKGNSSESVGVVASAEVLWESFGTSVTPNVGDLVKNASYSDGYITFQTADTFKEGNAVIAAKDASGNILWSWHIWLTDEPQGQIYYNNAGTMMDRNLGATSAIPGDVGALGLLYQWGRKDPFLGSSSISSNTLAMSTITWPSAVKSNASNGTIEYATTHPTTFITYNNNSNYDWYYTGSSSTDNTRWTESDKSKSIYDPCPSGWRVPDGGENGIWSIALGSSSSFIDKLLYDSIKEGINFSNKFGLNQEIWYPASGSRYNYNGELIGVGSGGYSWSASPISYNAYQLFFLGDGYIDTSYSLDRASGFSVRCVREGTTPSTPSTPYAVNLSEDGTANSYIVSQKGSYKFSTVKGNSSESVGAVASAEVLWETFGTSVTPNVGDLVKNASYSDGYITFQTADTFKEGNAVIAAKDASGNILWSWHIWLTDQPKEHVYRNNAGTMMDRNLGATSATPGDVEALGLLYQWGRKDPFLGSSSISQSVRATSTLEWPQSISSGNIQLSIENPTTFICQSSGDEDWYVTSPRNDDRWMTSKTIYDPCPYGWRVPDGSVNGIWDLAGFDDLPFDTQNKGISFEIESPATTWYPATGAISNDSGSLYNTAAMALYWSATPTVNKYANVLSLILDGTVIPWYYDVRATGNPVRCCKEESKQEESGDSNESEYGNYLDMSLAEDISVDGTANSYIISKSGTYKIKAVKGNSQELVGVSSNVDPVGEIYYADVMWESFGTAQDVKKRDLITAVYYEDSYVAFKTAEEFQEGNAVIAVRDEEGSVLWSWHIWMTDEPKGQVYYNDAGTMMDRNLGATSAKPGDVEAQGLLYQWGRKDPFLGASSIDGFEAALSTIEWPESVNMDSNSGTIAYATANPTTYISGNIEWMASPDENRWSETKTIYDPCPAGWHVPLGGMYGLIAEAVGDPSYFEYAFDDINKGMDFSGKFGADDIIWYPAFNGRSYSYGDFASKYYSNRYYWFCNFDELDMAFCMSLSSRGNVYPYNSQGTANALPVRCCKE